MTAHKICNKCGESKPYTAYYVGSGKYGRMGRCKVCEKPSAAVRMAQHRDRIGPAENRRRRARWQWRTRPGVVQVRTEDELRMALNDPYPFYAEPQR